MMNHNCKSKIIRLDTLPDDHNHNDIRFDSLSLELQLELFISYSDETRACNFKRLS